MASEINYLAPRERTRKARSHLINPPSKKRDMKAYGDVMDAIGREHLALPVKNEHRTFKICYASSTVDSRKRGCTLVRATYYLFVSWLNSAMYLLRLALSANVTGDRRKRGFRARL